MDILMMLLLNEAGYTVKYFILKAILALCIIGFEANTFAVTTSPKNSLTTVTITTSDINNKAEYSASSMSV